MFSARELAEQYMCVVEILVKLTPGTGGRYHQIVRRRHRVKQKSPERPGYPLKIVGDIILSESMTFAQHSRVPPEWIISWVVERLLIEQDVFESPLQPVTPG